MDTDLLIPLVAIVSLFIVFPGMVFHYVTLWRKQKTLEPDDERMLEDLWRSAKRMERRIETLEKLVDNNPEDAAPVSRQPRSSYDQ
ncbi:envelope stress response membrane protein PspB [Henriciella algicola]|jgi:phage shock protein B|uniref:Envelope stress response membrane protein PspB n=1 Tax=Henriciella algicola TaxID=1608422 RepID=A0A399RP65_9PROT|nr:envelope stress response membrane protein PspB [Henriciella algicola]RIJ32113.1 envelope stress response membrane protein PspB [Henriciella algicola]